MKQAKQRPKDDLRIPGRILSYSEMLAKWRWLKIPTSSPYMAHQLRQSRRARRHAASFMGARSTTLAIFSPPGLCSRSGLARPYEMSVELGVGAVVGEKLAVGPALDDAAMVENEHQVGVANRAQAMGD